MLGTLRRKTTRRPQRGACGGGRSDTMVLLTAALGRGRGAHSRANTNYDPQWAAPAATRLPETVHTKPASRPCDEATATPRRLGAGGAFYAGEVLRSGLWAEKLFRPGRTSSFLGHSGCGDVCALGPLGAGQNFWRRFAGVDALSFGFSSALLAFLPPSGPSPPSCKMPIRALAAGSRGAEAGRHRHGSMASQVGRFCAGSAGEARFPIPHSSARLLLSSTPNPSFPICACPPPPAPVSYSACCLDPRSSPSPSGH